MVEIVRFCLYLMLAVDHVRGYSRHRNHHNSNQVEEFQYEFGRASRAVLDDRIDFERSLQDLLEADTFFTSMSMSMSVPPGGRDATIPPATEPPSAILLAERLIPCAGSATTSVNITLDVELAVGKTDFAGDLEKALTTALASRNYAMCDPRRRLAESKAAHREKRRLQEPILLSPVIVTELAQNCNAQDASASSCRVASAQMEAFGTDNSQSVVASVDSIAKDDASFDTELEMNGIVDVRVVQEANRGTSIDASNAAATTSLSKTSVRSSQTVMAIVLSMAALTLVVALIIRNGARRKRHLWYGRTMEETYDENQCLGIQPRESFENTSDIDTFYSPKAEYPQAAIF